MGWASYGEFGVKKMGRLCECVHDKFVGLL